MITEQLIRLRAQNGTTEAAHGGRSFPIAPDGTVWVTAEAAPGLLNTGAGFTLAPEDPPPTLADIAELIDAMAAGQDKDALLAAIESCRASDDVGKPDDASVDGAHASEAAPATHLSLKIPLA